MSGGVTVAIPPALDGEGFVPVPSGEKKPGRKWLDISLSSVEAQQHLDRGGNIALRVGSIVDADLDSPEALELADTYLPQTGAMFGRPSKPRSHRLYRAAGAVYAAFADPLDGTMLAELRADGRDGGAHLTLIPPSITGGERREWVGETVEPAVVRAAILAHRMVLLAIGCLVMRHVSEYAAQRPGPDMPDLLWEADRGPRPSGLPLARQASAGRTATLSAPAL
jgi:Bifunctional DNA primase/polymerase, N-terminal